MTNIKAFKGFRPKSGLEEKIAARPYDVLNSAEARLEAAGNEYSFLRINKPEIDLPEGTDLYSAAVYNKGKENLDAFMANGWLVQDESPKLYIYEQTMGKHTQKGLVAASSIDDYFNDVIKKHEYTRPQKENDRIEHMATLSAHIGPVFLTYKPIKELDLIINTWCEKNTAVYDFVSVDGIGHRVWVIDDKTTITTIVGIFETKIPATYVADGHHRSAASAKVGAMLRAQKGEYTGKEEFNHFLSVLFPSNQLMIIDYNRLITDLNGLSNEAFLAALQTNFTISKEDSEVRPSINYEYGMYMAGQWYRLKADESITKVLDPVKKLDISILSDYVIDPILGIDDQRTSDRIDFVGGIRGLGELVKRVDSGEMKVAFAIHPVEIDQLMAVADSGNVMPPKTTWFEPKLRSGLVIHTF